MRKILLSVLLALSLTLLWGSCAAAEVAIDATRFPDEHFRAIVTAFDRDHNGALSDAELAAVKSLDCGW